MGAYIVYEVSQAEAEQVFANEPLLLAEDVAHSQLEPRFHALGVTQVRGADLLGEPRFDRLCRLERGQARSLPQSQTFDQGDFLETAGRFARADQNRG